jgi:predicted phage-related endonuclease
MSNYDVNYYEPQSVEWLAARMNFVTATEVSMLFGVDKYNSPTQLQRNKIIPKEAIKNKYIRMGILLEDSVLKAFRYDLGIDAQPIHNSKVVIYNLKDVKLSATPDGVFKHGDKKGLIECKSTSIKNFRNWEIEPPISYVLQCHAQLLCTGEEHNLLGCIATSDPMDFTAYHIKRDDEVNALLIEEVNRFWECMHNEEKFNVNIKHKKRIQEILPSTYKFLY